MLLLTDEYDTYRQAGSQTQNVGIEGFVPAALRQDPTAITASRPDNGWAQHLINCNTVHIAIRQDQPLHTASPKTQATAASTIQTSVY